MAAVAFQVPFCCDLLAGAGHRRAHGTLAGAGRGRRLLRGRRAPNIRKRCPYCSQGGTRFASRVPQEVRIVYVCHVGLVRRRLPLHSLSRGVYDCRSLLRDHGLRPCDLLLALISSSRVRSFRSRTAWAGRSIPITTSFFNTVRHPRAGVTPFLLGAPDNSSALGGREQLRPRSKRRVLTRRARGV